MIGSTASDELRPGFARAALMYPTLFRARARVSGGR
ncbi:hypothetical protein CLV29_1416 [Naumannella halotolerans]|uniref:Uncharacterized protein n=1 Tax=Naumannella halotolerans TaxID=993414 RepID=A0A4R7JA44_9ACTN|nr:hypothetical protein CLV29_1416 [Naumannella halotolerans]